MFPNKLVLLYSVNTLLSYTSGLLKTYRKCTRLKSKVTLDNIYKNHGDKIQCFDKISMTDTCCDDKNPQTESCKALLQETENFLKKLEHYKKN